MDKPQAEVMDDIVAAGETLLVKVPHAGAVLVVAALLLGGCSEQATPAASPPTGSPGAPSAAATSSSAVAGLTTIELPVSPGSTVEGLVDVDGHDLYARCSGSGSPTVVYFTGWAEDRLKRAVDLASGIENAVAGRLRVCSYERRNTGRSEEVPGTQSPGDIVADVDGVLDALGEGGPFLLLGASYGGLVSGVYAVAHPDRVAGVVLLDSSLPDDFLIDREHGFTGMCLPANRKADAWRSLERVDNCRLARWAYQRRQREPDVPLLYSRPRPLPGRRCGGSVPQSVRLPMGARQVRDRRRAALDGRV